MKHLFSLNISKRQKEHTCHKKGTTLAWGYYHGSLLLPEKDKIWNRDPLNSFILDTILPILFRKRLGDLLLSFNYDWTITDLKPNGYLKN